MRRALTLILLSAVPAVIGSAAASAVPIAIPPVPHIVATLGASVAPKKLAATKFTPAHWHVFGKVATSDGTHPPALREMELDVDKDVRLNVDGYPSCGIRKLRRPSDASVMAACGNALLGKGEARLEVAQAEGSPSKPPGHLLIFNAGEKEGVAKILVRASFPGEVVVATISVTKHGGGIHSVAQVPRIADGMGSLIDFTFTVGAIYRPGAEKVGYFEAKCPDGVFKANVKKIVFKNEANTPGEAASTSMKGSLAVPCTPSR